LLEDLEVYQAMARELRPETRRLDEAMAAKTLEVSLKRRDFFPEIGLTGDLTHSWSTEETAKQRICRIAETGGECAQVNDLFAFPYANPLDTLSVRIGLSMRWSFDFPQQFGKLRKSEAQLVALRAKRARAVAALDLALTKAWRDAADARERIMIQADRLESARRWRDQAGLTAQTSGGDISGAIEPLKAYYESKLLHLKAWYDYRVARAQLAKTIGVTTLDRSSAAE